MSARAQAIHLFELYKKTEGKDVTFLIASTDHHFSPVRKRGLTSRGVTDIIEDLFGIICDWPYQIKQILRRHIE